MALPASTESGGGLDFPPSARQAAAAADLQAFVRLKGWRRTEAALELFNARLSRNIDWFPIRAEYVDFLLLTGQNDQAIKACTEYIADTNDVEEQAVFVLSQSIAESVNEGSLTNQAIIQSSFFWDALVDGKQTMFGSTYQDTGVRWQDWTLSLIYARQISIILLLLRLAAIPVKTAPVPKDSGPPVIPFRALCTSIQDRESEPFRVCKGLFNTWVQEAYYWGAYRVFQCLSNILSISERDEMVATFMLSVSWQEPKEEIVAATLSMLQVYVQRLYEESSSYTWDWNDAYSPLADIVGSRVDSGLIFHNLTAFLRTQVSNTEIPAYPPSIQIRNDIVQQLLRQELPQHTESAGKNDEKFLVPRPSQPKPAIGSDHKVLQNETSSDTMTDSQDSDDDLVREPIGRDLYRDPGRVFTHGLYASLRRMEPTLFQNECSETAFWQIAAAAEGCLDLVRMMVKDTAPSRTRPDDGTHSLMFLCASGRGHLETVKSLLENRGPTIEYKSSEGRTAFSCAAEGGFTPVIQHLHSVAGRNLNTLDLVNIVDNSSRSPLHYAAEAGKADTVSFLCKLEHIEVNKTDKDDRTALFLAAEKGHSDVVESILENKDTIPNLGDLNGLSPLAAAAKHRRPQALAILIFWREISLRGNCHEGQSLAESVISQGTWTSVELLLNLLILQEDYSKDEKQRLIYQAACSIRKQVVEGLLAANPHYLDIADQHGRTILGAAAVARDWEILEPLLKRDSLDIENSGIKDANLLHAGASAGMKSVVKALLAHDPSLLNTLDTDSRTILIAAAVSHEWEIVEKLLRTTGVNVNHQDIHAKSAITYFLDGQNLYRLDWAYAALAFLDHKEIDPNLANARGATLLSLAIDSKNIRLLEAIVAREDVIGDKMDAKGRTPLSHAAEGGSIAVVELLLRRWKHTASWKDQNEMSPLDYARKKQRKKVEHLLEDITKTGHEGV